MIGASGRSGAALCRALGDRVVPVVRSPAKWSALGLPGAARTADLGDPGALAAALRDATHIVSCAHARHAQEVIAAAPLPAVLIFLGSTRKFTRWPDDHGNGVLAGEAAFLASGRSGVMLHPTMIYGAEGEDNVRRLAKLTKYLPVVPLPDRGGALVQPIHQSDVTRCIAAAVDRSWDGPNALVVAGPEPVPYRDFLRAVAVASGARPPLVVNAPAWALMAASWLTRFVPGLPRIGPDEVRRLTEDKAFSIDAMRGELGVSPLSLGDGLALTFPRLHDSGR